MANLATLYRLQQNDTQMETLERELHSLNETVEGETEFNAAQDRLEKSRADKREAERKLKDAELQLASVESEKKKIREKLFGGKVVNPKELTQLENDLEQIQKRLDKLDDQVLREMDRAEAIAASLKEAEASFEKAKGEFEKTKSDQEGRKTELARKIEEIKSRREQLAQSLDFELLDQYTALKERRGGLAVATLRKNSCSGCFMQVPESTIIKVKHFELERCSSCGRILYLDKESG